MNVESHRKTTGQAMNAAGVTDRRVVDEVMAGSVANDLCEFTNEGTLLLKTKEAIGTLFRPRLALFGNMAIYQSHFGPLACLHAMATASGVPARETARQLASLCEFLTAVSLGEKKVTPGARIKQSKLPGCAVFGGTEVTFTQLFDTRDARRIKYRAVGMLLHVVQDSFTQSHCLRKADHTIGQFYYYGDQSPGKHEKKDTVPAPFRPAMMSACNLVVSRLLGQQTAVDPAALFRLSGSAVASGPGAAFRK